MRGYKIQRGDGDLERCFYVKDKSVFSTIPKHPRRGNSRCTFKVVYYSSLAGKSFSESLSYPTLQRQEPCDFA